MIDFSSIRQEKGKQSGWNGGLMNRVGSGYGYGCCLVKHAKKQEIGGWKGVGWGCRREECGMYT